MKKETKETIQGVLFELTVTILGLFAIVWLVGCAHRQRSVELQCTPALKEDIEGAVIVKDGELVFYDSKGKLRKVSGTCGLR